MQSADGRAEVGVDEAIEAAKKCEGGEGWKMLTELKATNALLVMLIGSIHSDKIPALGVFMLFMGLVLLGLSSVSRVCEWMIEKQK
jgi:hypothetical protein